MGCRFLQGDVKYSFATILQEVMQDPVGKAKRGSDDEDLMYSTTESYLNIRLAVPSITTLAVALVRDRLSKELKKTVRESSGLHGSTPPTRRGGLWSLSWKDISEKTPERVQEIFEHHMPLGTALVRHLVAPTKKTSGLGERSRRPPNLVSIYVWYAM